MSAALKRALLVTMGWLAFGYLLIPSFENRWFGQSSLLRFDPKVSTDYDCIFVEGHSRPSFAVAWMIRSTPIEYLRIRYTPLADDQPYGIMFIDPRTLAYEAHAGFAKKPTRLSARLASPVLIRGWMRSQPRSAQAASHDGDAQEIYDAVLALSHTDLEHFTLPEGVKLSHFQVGHASLTNHCVVSWHIIALPLIPFWIQALGRRVKKQPNQLQEPPAGRRGSALDCKASLRHE